MEEALQDAVDDGRIQIPVFEVDFSGVAVVDPGSDKEGLYEPIGRVTSLEALHRVAHAILRDSELDGVAFRETPLGKKIGMANLRNATPLYEICPTALLLGIWDSTGPKGGLGTKFQRALVSEIIGVNASYGTKTSSRIDPLAIRKDAAIIYEMAGGAWTLDAAKALQEKSKPKTKGKDGKPSEANHGNIVPSLSNKNRDGIPLAGVVTIDYAEQMTVLSLPAIRRLRFPVDGKEFSEMNIAARTVITSLGLCGAVLAAERGLDLRSRCLLWPTAPLKWELLQTPSKDPASLNWTPRQRSNYFESEGTDKEQEAERDALDWLSSLDSAPEIRHCLATLGSEYTCYVPVNDNQTPNKAMLQSAPGMPRSRQPRTFPTVIPQLNHDTEAHVQLVWNCGEVPIAHHEAIDRICRNVIRVGHSSSLVMMWTDVEIPKSSQLDRFVQSDDSPQQVLRVATSGELDRLQRSCQAGKIDLFADLAERISTLKGQEKTEAKAEFEKTFGEP